jgi:hypothetical protein
VWSQPVLRTTSYCPFVLPLLLASTSAGNGSYLVGNPNLHSYRVRAICSPSVLGCNFPLTLIPWHGNFEGVLKESLVSQTDSPYFLYGVIQFSLVVRINHLSQHHDYLACWLRGGIVIVVSPGRNIPASGTKVSKLLPVGLRKSLLTKKAHQKTNWAVYSCNPCTWEAEAGV